MEKDRMQDMTHAAIINALNELQEFSPGEGGETMDTLSGRDCLHEMLLTIVQDADRAGRVPQDASEDLSYLKHIITGVICGLLYRSVFGMNVNSEQKIAILNRGLKDFGLDEELSGEMFFGESADHELTETIANLLEDGLATAMEGALKGGNPEAGVQFAFTLTNLMAQEEKTINEAFPDAGFVLSPGASPIRFAQEYFIDQLYEMEEDDPALRQLSKEEIEQRENQEAARHILTVARRERQNGHMESATQLYQFVLDRTPENWEARFFAALCPLYTESPDQVVPEEIPDNTKKVMQGADGTLPVITDQLRTKNDIYHALTQITDQCVHLATNYYIATLNLCKPKLMTEHTDEERIERIGAVIGMLFHVGDVIETYFSGDRELCAGTAAVCWDLAFACYENCDMPTPDGAQEHLDKIRAYDPSYHCSKPLT